MTKKHGLTQLDETKGYKNTTLQGGRLWMEPTSSWPLSYIMCLKGRGVFHPQIHFFNLAFILFLNLFSLISREGLACDISVSGFRDRSAARVIQFLMRVTKESLILDKDTSSNGLNNIKVQYIKESHRHQLTHLNAVMSVYSRFYIILPHLC